MRRDFVGEIGYVIPRHMNHRDGQCDCQHVTRDKCLNRKSIMILPM